MSYSNSEFQFLYFRSKHKVVLVLPNPNREYGVLTRVYYNPTEKNVDHGEWNSNTQIRTEV